MKKLLVLLFALTLGVGANAQVQRYVSPGIGYSPTDVTYGLEAGFTAGRFSYGGTFEHNVAHDTHMKSTYVGPKAYLQLGPTDGLFGFYTSFAIKGGLQKCLRTQYEPGVAVVLNTSRNTGVQFSFTAPYSRGSRPSLGTGVSLNFNF